MIACCLLTNAQMRPNEVHQHYQSTYPEESGIITEFKRVITIRRSGDSLDINTDQYKEVLILDKPLGWVKEKVYSNTFSKVEKLEAYTLLPGKRNYKKVDVEDFKKSYDKDTYVFYDDTEVINFNFPQLTEGAKKVTSQSWKTTDPHVIPSYYFSSFVPTLHASFQIVVEEGIEVMHGVLNDSTLNIRYSEEVLKDGTKVFTYEAKNIPKIDYQEDNPGFGYLSPSVYVMIASYKNFKNENIQVLSSLDDLHAWYRSFTSDIKVDSSLLEVTRQIVDEDDTKIEKVKKIFYWVQKNIKYIAFEDGMRGFIPHPANYVLEKRYGDCKDMTSILIGLLQSEGIDAQYTWVGTRDIPYRYSEIPSPFVDNHMIASVKIDGEIYFLDATGSYSPLGYPTSMIQGKECLISYTDNYEVVEVPVIEKEKNQMNDTSTIWMKEGVLYGEGKVTISGLAKVANTHQLIQRTSKGEDNYVRRLLSRGNNKFLVDDYDVQNVEELDHPIEISYTFNVADYYREVGNEIYINLCLDRSLINQAIKDRETAVENDYKFISSSNTTLKIPDGYRVKYVPEGGKVDSPHLGYRIDYNKDSSSITFSSHIYINFLLMYPDSFSTWNEVIEKYARLTRRTIVLEKI